MSRMFDFDFTSSDWRDWWNTKVFDTTGYKNQAGVQDAMKFRQHFREVVSTIDPSLSDQHLENFVDYSLPMHAYKINSMFRGVNSTDVMNDKIADYVRMSKEQIERSIKAYRQSVRGQGVIGNELDDSAYHQVGHTTLNNKLRSRYGIAGTNAVAEPWKQSLIDTTSADLFSWQPSTSTGVYSSVHLDEKRHEAFLAIGANAPRSFRHVEQLVGTGKIPSVWDDTQPVVEATLEMMDEQFGMAMAAQGPPTSTALEDQRPMYEAFRGHHELTFMTPAFAVDKQMHKDMTRQTDLQQMHEVGFREQNASWREPLKPEDDMFLPVLKPKQQSERVLMNGYSTYMTF